MARKPPKVEAEESPERKGHKAVLDELRENVKLDLEADNHNRESFKEALKFCYVKGEQWEASVKAARGPKRISREFNETRPKVKLVVNHIRANRPAAKIHPVEEGDVDTAEAFQGLWLNIWNTSDADNITDFAAETQVAAGMGAWRVDTEYCEDSADDQNIVLKSIRNPLCLIPDRAAKEQDKSDARHWTYATKITKAAHESKYKGKEVASFAAADFGGDNDPNNDDDMVWIAEYWRKEPTTRVLCKLSTGETVDKATLGTLNEGVTIVKERTVKTHKIVQYVCSATAVLEGPNEWAGKEFPFVVVYGEYVVVDGKTYWSGMTQTMMDAQKSHNEVASGVYESIASADKAEDWATPEQAKGLMAQWEQSREKRIGVRLYNHDPKEPGPPKRTGGPDVPVAMMQAMQISRDQMNSISIVPDAVSGLTSNETSGKAIRARQDSGMVGTYNYSDNIAKGVGRTCKIVLDLIPKIIDTPRSIRILGKDGAEKYIKVNQRDPITGEVVNDLSRGKYDFVVTQGPNAATQRIETQEWLLGMAQSDEMLMPTAGDIVYDNSDVPGAKAIAERRRAMLPAPIQALINKDAPEDPRVAAAMQEIQLQQQQMQEQAQLVEQAAGEAQTEKAAAEKAKADVQIALANLKTEQANFATQQAQFQALVANTQAKFAQEDAADVTAKSEEATGKAEASEADTESAIAAVGEALVAIQQQSAQQAQALAALIQQMAEKPKTPKTMTTQRVNGGYQTVITDESTGESQVAHSQKVNGAMVTRVAPSIQ